MSYTKEKIESLSLHAEEINFKHNFEEIEDWKAIGGIFAIYNQERNKIYISNTDNFFTRYLNYLYVDNDRGIDGYMKDIIYGGNMEILEVIDDKPYREVLEIEKDYIRKFLSMSNMKVVNKGAKARAKKEIILPNIDELYKGLDYYPDFMKFNYGYYMGLGDFVNNFPISIGRNTFYGFLRGKDILRPDGVPNIDYVAKGYFAVSSGFIRSNQFVKAYLTPNGKEWLFNKCKEWGIVKEVEINE